MKIEETIRAWAKERGYHITTGDVSLVKEVLSSLQKRRDKGEIEGLFYTEYLEKLSHLEGHQMKDSQSVLIVAIPRPAHTLSFSLGEKTIKTVLPPTYVRYLKTFDDVRDDLASALYVHGCHLEILNAPLKALANLMGILSYGRNNIGYIGGLGSYFQLVGLLSDKRIGNISNLDAPAKNLLDRCRECRICARACPMGAIDGDRILLHGERCYTLFSESPEPLPEDLKPPSPRCLIGCMRCQQVCPENKGHLRYEEAAVSFDSEETMAFLGEDGESLQAKKRVEEKFLQLGLTEEAPIFVRNLKKMLKLRRIVI